MLNVQLQKFIEIQQWLSGHQWSELQSEQSQILWKKWPHTAQGVGALLLRLPATWLGGPRVSWTSRDDTDWFKLISIYRLDICKQMQKYMQKYANITIESYVISVGSALSSTQLQRLHGTTLSARHNRAWVGNENCCLGPAKVVSQKGRILSGSFGCLSHSLSKKRNQWCKRRERNPTEQMCLARNS